MLSSSADPMSQMYSTQARPDQYKTHLIEGRPSTSNLKARLDQDKAHNFEALWNEFEKNRPESQQDLPKSLAKLTSSFRSPDEVTDYFEWVKSHRLKARSYSLSPYELAIDLKAANWIEGNDQLLHLNSLLSYSITAGTRERAGRMMDLGRTYKGYSLGLHIHGRPIAKLQADPEAYANAEIAVNSELVLAMGYYAHANDAVKTKSKKATILFAPLGYILAEFNISKKEPVQWVRTGLVLVAEIQDNGEAGSLHLIFPWRDHGDDKSEAYDRPAAISDDEWQELRKFQSDLPFTVAKLEDGFSLLNGATTLNGNRELITTVVSDLPVEIVETGSSVTGEPGIPFPLYPDDQSTEPPIKGA